MSDPVTQVNFRMPASLKAKLETAAAANRRSLTAEIVARLETSFPLGQEDMFAGFGNVEMRSSQPRPRKGVPVHIDATEFMQLLERNLQELQDAMHSYQHSETSDRKE